LACVYLMVIAAFYVMTAEVSAEDVTVTENEIEDAVSNLEHIDRRITISNSKASSPVVAVGTDGETHIAWVDGALGSQSVCWKRSNDSLSTFTSDRTVTATFHSISDLAIVLDSAFGVAIAFEGRMTADGSPAVYFLYSKDSDDWSAACAVSAGSDPSLTTDGDSIFIALNAASEGTERFSIAALRLIDGTVNATLLAALPVPAADGDIAYFDDMLNVALIEESSDALYFMQLADDGTVVTEPTLVSGTDNGCSVDLVSVNGNERILFVENDSIMLARCLGNMTNWISHTVLEMNGTATSASLASSGSSLRIAYAVITEECSNVYVVECDLQGNAGDVRCISTPGLDAVMPAVFSTSPGSFSCVYAEEHSGAQELFLRQDIDYVVPDMARLPDFISSLGRWMFRDGNGSASELRDRVNIILAHRKNNSEVLAIENATGLEDDLESYFVSVPYADLDEVEDVKDVIESNLASVDDPSSGIIVMSLPPIGPPGGGTIYYEPVFVFDLEAVTNTIVRALWYYQEGGRTPNVVLGTAGYLMWGTSSSNLTNMVNGTDIGGRENFMIGSLYDANITGLNSSTTYYAKAYVATNTTTYSSSVKSFSPYPGSLIIQNISVTTSAGSSTITWTTNGRSDSRVDYGTTTSYGGCSCSDTLVWTHSRTISGLASGTTYHYKITSAYAAADFSLNATSSDHTFTSAQVTLTITSVAAVLTDLNAVRVTWNTNIAATSVVYFGTTPAYGSTASGTSGTSHTVDISGLDEATLYHFKVRSASVAYPGVVTYGSDGTFSTKNSGDAGLGFDAGDAISSASLLSPGAYTGYLDSSLDLNDHYSLPMLSGETVKLSLDVPSAFNYQLYLYDPSGTLAASSTNGVGVDESLQYAINANGAWKVRVFHQSGSGQGLYSLDMQVLGAYERFSLDVGAAGDSDVLSHTPGLAIMDGTGWYTASSGARETTANGSFLLNIYDGTYQSYTYYEVSMTYTSSAEVGVSIMAGDSWVMVTTLPGKTTAWTHTFVLRSDMLSDSSAALFACNVRLRFDHQVIVDSIDVVPVAYASDLFGSSQNYPGVMLENYWAVGDGVVNGSASATLIVTLPRPDQTYLLEFVNLDSCSGVGVQQYVGSAYSSIGTLESWGTSAVVQIDPTYTDVLSSTPGISVRVKLTSPLINLTRIVLWTSRSYTDVGVAGDVTDASHTPGISLLGNGEWGSITTVDSRTARRTVAGSNANFYLNGAESGAQYLISITYKATSGSATIKQFSGSASTVTLGSLTVNNQWCTSTFVTSASNNYDYVSGGQVNVLFEMTSASSVAVDSLTVYQDRDGDTMSDAVESLRVTMSAIGTHVHDLNPFSADTDSDGLNDNVEVSTYTTNPCNPDSDSDGLLDGSEKYSYAWSTDNSYLIPDNGATLAIDLSLPAIQGGTSSISSLCLVLGIMHGSQYQLEVKVQKGTGTQKVIKAANTGSGANYFILKNLFTISSPYTASDLTSANVWHIYIRDVTAGTQGRVEYARLQVNGTTNPLDSDSDDDLILDGEEVEFGDDGWCTNPRSTDSDSDGVTDWNEIHGNTLCSTFTDPTRSDTDDDGFADNVDRYLGDAVLRVTIMEYETLDTINGQDNVPVFFVINYQDEGQEFATKRVSATKNILYALNWVYDVDIPETATYVNVEFEAVAENTGWIGDDAQLDIDQDSTNKYNAYWTISSTPFVGIGTDSGGSYDAYLKVKLEKAVAEKARVIVINGTGEDGDYGLDAVSTGVYRYSADDQVYLIDLNVSTANGRFQQGINTIILPRAIALQCQLNDTLYDLASISSGDPLYGASFYSTNMTSACASGHVIAVISKNVTAAQAEAILTKLTHNATGGRIGNNVTISSTAVYLLHLPNDILSAIPTFVMNAGMGEGPNYLNPLGIISDIAGMVFDFLVWVATGGLLLLFVHLVEMGLEVIGQLASDLWDEVQDAVDAIVDAFWAFVDWMIDYICDMFSTLIAEPLNSMMEGFGQWANGLLSFIDQASSDIEGGGGGSQFTSALASNILNSEFYVYLNIIGLSLFIVITVASMLGPAGFISSLVLPSLLNVIISGLITTAFYVVENYSDAIWDILGDELAVGMSGVLGAVIGTIDWIKAMMSSPTLGDMKGFICSTLGLFFAWWAALTDDWTTALIFNALGVGFAIYGAWSTFINPSDTLLKNPTALGIYKGIVIIEGGIATFGLITTVASYEQ